MSLQNFQPITAMRALRAAGLALSVSLALLPSVRAETALSQASAASTVPLAISVAAPSAIGAGVLSVGAAFTVVSVELLAEGTVWVLARASDGARVVVRCAGKAVGTASQAVGTAVTVVGVSGGVMLSTASEVIAFVPNEIGKALLHNEQITR
jgi:hypothetical protein